jgi:PBP1b-binding outer membrane lipoprotein LpoB
MKRMKRSSKIALVACALALAACAGDNDERDAMGSHLQQPPAGTRRPAPVDAGDIAIVGQDVAHEIMQLSPIASASVPPLVRFNGVTSIINPPIDTEPYTDLLRDRLLLLTRAKLRFVEHTLPPYVPGDHKKHSSLPSSTGGDAQYQVLAEMRGQADADAYKIQIEFVEIASGDILFNETYRVAKEAGSQPDADQYTSPMAPPPQQPQAPPAPRKPSAPSQSEEPQQSPPPGYYYPQPSTNNGSGNNGVL